MRDSSSAGVLMKPEGSRKVVVLNGSRQIDQVIGGEWQTQKVLPENGLPKGIYQLADAKAPENSAKPVTYTGAILQVDSSKVFQLCGKNIIRHDRASFRDIDNGRDSLVVGRTHSVEYVNGRGRVTGTKEPEAAKQRTRSGGAEL